LGQQAKGEMELPIDSVRPSPANDMLNKPIDPDAPDIQELAASIREFGQLEAGTVSLDDFIISGHRRHVACRLAGKKTFLCKREPILSANPEFLRLLRECNRQRVKTFDETVREEIVSANPEEARSELIKFRKRKERTTREGIYEIDGEMRRHGISENKRPFLEAIIKVLEERKKYWPLTVRQIHYGLLNHPPLKLASLGETVMRKLKDGTVKEFSNRYANDITSYKTLDDLTVRARLAGLIPWSAIHDPTRHVTTWDVHPNPQPFLSRELNELFKGYYRNLQQSQPNHIEIVIEKSTVENIVRPVAVDYVLPVTPERGQCGITPRKQLSDRFKKSGKGKLILLIMGDHDPDGETIVNAFCKSMRDDFDIPMSRLEPRWICLNRDQVEEMELPKAMAAKETSVNYDKFVAKYDSTATYELEAVPPAQMQQIVRDAIEGVLDKKAFDTEQEREARDAAELETLRRRVLAAIGPLPVPDGESEEEADDE
jgi:hypothetical protein